MGRLAGYRPERYLAGIAYAPGQYEPLGMDTIELSLEAIAKPQLIIANGADNTNRTERPYNYFRKYFDRGAPWTFVLQNRTPHGCLQNAQTLILDLAPRRIDHAVECPGPGPRAYFTPEATEILDTWKHPVFNIKSSRVAPTSKPRPNELPAGWMP